MPVIKKAVENMSSVERVARTFAFEKTDRILIGYDANPVIHGLFSKAMGIDANDQLALYKTIGVDYVGHPLKYMGPQIYDDLPDRKRDPEFGAVMRYMTNEYGYYWDFCDFPLENACDEKIAAYPLPDPDDYDYDEIKAYVDTMRNEGFAVFAGGAGFGNIINKTGKLFGMENALMNLYTKHEATLELLDKRLGGTIKIMERVLEENKRKFSFLWMGEDLGMQHTALISLDMYREVLQPRHQLFIDLAHNYNLPVLMHTCGSSSWVYEDFIEMGVNGVETLQPEASLMSPEYLSENFGGRLNFRGCISTAGALAYGTEKEIKEECIRVLEVMMGCKGYHFAPCHAIQDNTPVENIISMYETAHEFGVY